MKYLKKIALIIVMIFACFICLSNYAKAENSISTYYPSVTSFESSEDYAYTGTSTSSFSYGSKSVGGMSFRAIISKETTHQGVKAYEFQSTMQNFQYNLSSLTNITDNNYSIQSDDSKVVEGITLDSKIQKGALIFQKSSDLNEWSTISVKTNFLDSSNVNQSNFIEGYGQEDLKKATFYRVLLAYKLKNKTTSEIKYCVEKYEFFVCSRNPYIYFYDFETGAQIQSGSSCDYGFIFM